MKIAHVGKNLANVPFLIVRALRKIGIPAELFIGRISTMGEVPYEYSEWIHYMKYGSLSEKFALFFELSKNDYAGLQTYAGSSVFTQFINKPYVVYATGSDLLGLSERQDIGSFLMRRSITHAKSLTYGNVPLLYDAKKIRPDAKFIPQPIFFEDFAPIKERTDTGRQLKIFCPSRIDFRTKGTNIFFRGFARAIRKRKDLYLTFIDWGPDSNKIKKFIKENNLGGYVHSTLPFGKKELIEQYQLSDIVVDQFIFGGFGMVGIEAMACGKPILSYINNDDHISTYGSIPPVLNARNENEITNILSRIQKEECRSVGEKGKKWLKKYHDWNVIANKYKKIYMEHGLL